jgi:hypothetical protein
MRKEKPRIPRPWGTLRNLWCNILFHKTVYQRPAEAVCSELRFCYLLIFGIRWSVTRMLEQWMVHDSRRHPDQLLTKNRVFLDKRPDALKRFGVYFEISQMMSDLEMWNELFRPVKLKCKILKILMDFLMIRPILNWSYIDRSQVTFKINVKICVEAGCSFKWCASLIFTKMCKCSQYVLSRIRNVVCVKKTKRME